MAKDNTLVHRARSGDEGAFADLMRQHYPFVYAIVARIVKNSHDAEEVVQDTFLNAYRGLMQLEDTTKFKSWLGEIAQNCGRNWLRKQRDDTVSIDEVSEQMLQTADSSDERLIQQEQRELIRRTMETLPQKDREIAQAFYLEGASYDELTSTHGLSYSAIASRLSRAKRQLTKRLQYLLTGILVSPATTLKKMYSGGLTAMKVGTVPKITVGVAVLIALIFVSFIGIRQLTAPTVEERVYLSPWEDGTPRPRNNSEGLAAATDSTQDIESRDNQSQTVTVEMEPTDDFFSRSQETDTTQFAADTESEIDANQDLLAEISALLDDEGRSAEDVMYAYLEALRNLDGEGVRALMAGAIKEEFESAMLPLLNGELPKEMVDRYYSLAHDILPAEKANDMVNKMIQTTKEMARPTLRRTFSQADITSSKYVDDEFHFQMKIPLPEMLDVPGMEVPEMPNSLTPLYKMRKISGVWQIYDNE